MGAKIVGLSGADAWFAKFREQLIDALHGCICAYIYQTAPLSRASDANRHLKKVAKEAKALARQLRDFKKNYPVHPYSHPARRLT